MSRMVNPRTRPGYGTITRVKPKPVEAKVQDNDEEVRDVEGEPVKPKANNRSQETEEEVIDITRSAGGYGGRGNE